MTVVFYCLVSQKIEKKKKTNGVARCFPNGPPSSVYPNWREVENEEIKNNES